MQVWLNNATRLVESNTTFLLSQVEKYPHLNIVNFDKLDYCSCLKNLDQIKGARV